jgi:ubiquinone/menaquinone biosynthesis C-methylase UbiE
MMYLAHNNKLYLSPIENPQKVIDVGTGTGIWAMFVFPSVISCIDPG